MAILSGSISKEIEIWKDIVGYEGLYQISNLGRVKSLKRYVPHFKGGLKVVPERIKTIFYEKSIIVLPMLFIISSFNSIGVDSVALSVWVLCCYAFLPIRNTK